MPQLDPSVFSPQLIWLAITFTVLYLIMARKALPRVADVLDNRANKIADDLRVSEELKDKSKALEAEHDKAQAEAKAEANRILSAAREKMQAGIEAKRNEAEGKLLAEVQAAEAKIATAKAEAMDDLEDMAVEACAAIVERLTGKSISVGGLRDTVKSEIRAVTGGKGA